MPRKPKRNLVDLASTEARSKGRGVANGRQPPGTTAKLAGAQGGRRPENNLHTLQTPGGRLEEIASCNQRKQRIATRL
jgi:hypothetical protein